MLSLLASATLGFSSLPEGVYSTDAICVCGTTTRVGNHAALPCSAPASSAASAVPAAAAVATAAAAAAAGAAAAAAAATEAMAIATAEASVARAGRVGALLRLRAPNVRRHSRLYWQTHEAAAPAASRRSVSCRLPKGGLSPLQRLLRRLPKRGRWPLALRRRLPKGGGGGGGGAGAGAGGGLLAANMLRHLCVHRQPTDLRRRRLRLLQLRLRLLLSAKCEEGRKRRRLRSHVELRRRRRRRRLHRRGGGVAAGRRLRLQLGRGRRHATTSSSTSGLHLAQLCYDLGPHDAIHLVVELAEALLHLAAATEVEVDGGRR